MAMVSATTPVQPLGYQPALDGVRAVAITMVIAAHVGVRHAGGGVIGVDLFFVLSGFLITTLLLEEHAPEQRIDLKAFYLRRALRLLPALFAVVVATNAYLAIDRANPAGLPTLRATPATLFYYANWQLTFGGTASLGWFWHIWSLAVEEQFYVLWPVALTIVLGRRWTIPRVTTVLGALAIGSAVSRSLGAHWNGGGAAFATPFVADQLLYGCMLALLLQSAHAGRIRAVVPKLAWLALAYLAAYVLAAGWGRAPAGGIAFVGVATAVVLCALIEAPQSFLARSLSRPAIVSVGRISYGMYLWHVLVSLTLAERVHFRHELHPVYWVGAYLLTVVVAAASYRIIEARALRLKRRLRPA